MDLNILPNLRNNGAEITHIKHRLNQRPSTIDLGDANQLAELSPL